jgi:two-component system, OmpR family, response regulator
VAIVAGMAAQQHILVVDDDADIRTLLADYLRQNGFRATTVADGIAMRRALAREHVDLLVLDIMLRGEDGLALCRAVRQDSDLPIVMLTARGDAVDKIVGFEMGADDYLAKPFSPRELLVRIKSVLRRAGRQGLALRPDNVQRYHFDTWTLDMVTRNLSDAEGVVVPLSGVQFRLLSRLLAAGQRVLLRSQLMESAGDRGGESFYRTIDVCISRLRQILHDDAREPRLIKTVYGEGYVIGVEVTSS